MKPSTIIIRHYRTHQFDSFEPCITHMNNNTGIAERTFSFSHHTQTCGVSYIFRKHRDLIMMDYNSDTVITERN